MIILRRALQRLSLLGLIASPFLSPAAADAITGVGKFGRPEERSLISLNPSVASAFILGKPGTSSALGFTTNNCDSSNDTLTMVPLDLKSSFQMWKYDSSTSSIQSIACPNKVIAIISNSSCVSIQVTEKGSTGDNTQKFSFEHIANFSDDETTGVRITSSALDCGQKVLSEGGSDGSIGYTIKMRGKILFYFLLF